MKTPIIYKDESYAIIGACFNVYKDKGSAYTESIYHECLEIEFDFLKLPFHSKPQLPLQYRGQVLRHRFEPDFICYNKIVLEIKSVSALCDEHRSQLLNYLEATGYELGLLVNFGAYPRLEYERIANTKRRIEPIRNGPLPEFPKDRGDGAVYI